MFDINTIFPHILDLGKATITVVISGIVSICVARHQARVEIKKALLTSRREDILKFRACFSEMTSAVDSLLEYGFLLHKEKAIKANMDCISVAPKKFHRLLLEMDDILHNGGNSEISKKKKALLKCYSKYIQKTNH